MSPQDDRLEERRAMEMLVGGLLFAAVTFVACALYYVWTVFA